jgi:hypothetical protein
VGLIVPIMGVRIIAPGVVLSAIGLPARLIGIDGFTLRLPAGFGHRLMAIMLRGGVKPRRPSQVLSRHGRLTGGGVIIQDLTVRAIDHRQLAVAIAI